MLLSGLFSCKNRSADLIFINGRIHVMDSTNTIVQALAIKDGKIQALGPTEMMLSEFTYDSIIDLNGASVFPGFIDAHCHFMGYARTLSQINLVGTLSFDAVLSLVDSFAVQNPKGWILGRGWDQNDWMSKSFPNYNILNSKYPDRPVFLQRIDGHAALVNKAALRLAGITDQSQIHGGKILFENGKMTGILLDNAVDSVQARIPKDFGPAYVSALQKAEKECFSFGISTLSDAGLDLREIQFLDSLQKAGILKMRIYAMANPSKENFEFFAKNGKITEDRLHVCAIKIYADGALGSRGACLLSPYTDQKDTHGFLLHSPDYYLEMAIKIRGLDFQMNTHCIGDSANRLLLKTYGEVIGQVTDHRWRIEHAQVVNPDDMALFSTYQIIPSVQPTHATSDMYWTDRRLGMNRESHSFAYQSLLQQNHIIAFGTDFPVEKINPLYTLYAACERKDLSGYPMAGYQMEQSCSRYEALQAMTSWAAYANFEEKVKGQIKKGLWADLVVIPTDLTFCEPEEIIKANVELTLINGEIVYSRIKP